MQVYYRVVVLDSYFGYTEVLSFFKSVAMAMSATIDELRNCSWVFDGGGEWPEHEEMGN